MSDATIEAARDLLGDSLDELRGALDGCSTEQLNQRLGGDETNSLAVIATHSLYSTRSWLSLATGADLPSRDRDAEFEIVVSDPAAFMAWFDRIASECRAKFEGDGSFDSARIGTAPWRPGELADEPVTAAWALLHALSHLREHVGHAQLTRQAL